MTLQRPARDFGYFLGDTLTACATIVTDGDTVLDAASLPQPGPVSRLVDIRRVEMSGRRADGGRIYRVRIEYQSFFGPDAAARQDVPGYSVDFTAGAKQFSAQIPAWTFMASPLRHDVAAMTDPRGLRADHAASPLPDTDARRILAGGLAACVVALGILAARSGFLPPSRHLPFTAASRRIGHLLRRAGGGRLALQALHRAFDTTAGRTILADDIGSFVAQDRRFVTLRADIELFFTASQRCFFGDASDVPAETAAWLAAFGRRLARAERG